MEGVSELTATSVFSSFMLLLQGCITAGLSTLVSLLTEEGEADPASWTNERRVLATSDQ